MSSLYPKLLSSTSHEALVQAGDIENKEQFARIADEVLWKIENLTPITLELSTKQFNAIRAALKAAKSLGLGIAGVDMLQSKKGPLIMEVNSSPGLVGIEGATGKDIANAIIRYIERLV